MFIVKFAVTVAVVVYVVTSLVLANKDECKKIEFKRDISMPIRCNKNEHQMDSRTYVLHFKDAGLK